MKSKLLLSLLSLLLALAAVMLKRIFLPQYSSLVAKPREEGYDFVIGKQKELCETFID